MNKEFRAWDGAKMRDVYQLQIRKDGVAAYYHEKGCSNGWRLKKIDNPIVVQFTGLLDKHKKKIFEGDILNLNKKILVSVVWCDENASFVTEWIDEQGHKCLSEHLYGAEYCEIVGNSFENPELIKDK